MKVAFCRKFSLQPYGFNLPEEDIEYVSFSSCCRKSLSSPINLDKLYDLWHIFINDFLFESVLAREAGETPIVSSAEICNHLKNLKKIGGLLSESEILKEIQNVDAKEGELCAFGIVKNDPKTNKHKLQNEILRLYSRQKFHLNMIKAFPLKTVKQVLSYSTYIKLIFFRKPVSDPDLENNN